MEYHWLIQHCQARRGKDSTSEMRVIDPVKGLEGLARHVGFFEKDNASEQTVKHAFEQEKADLFAELLTSMAGSKSAKPEGVVVH